MLVTPCNNNVMFQEANSFNLSWQLYVLVMKHVDKSHCQAPQPATEVVPVHGWANPCFCCFVLLGDKGVKSCRGDRLNLFPALALGWCWSLEIHQQQH